MATLLKQSTTVTLRVGPFLDVGGNEKTSLTPTFEVSKNHGAFAARNSATAPTHDSNAWYTCELNATDTGTLGPMRVKADDSANHLPVWHDLLVVPAPVFEAIVNGEESTLIRRGTAQGGTSGGITLDAGASAVDGFYKSVIVQTVSGTGAGQSRYATGYVGSTKVLSVSPIWITTPDNTTVFRLLAAGRVDLESWRGSVPNDLDTGNVLAKVAASTATSLDATNVKADTAAIKTKVDELHDNRITSTRAGYLDKLNISGNVAGSTEVLAIQNNTRVRIPVPGAMERPDSGSTAYELDLYLYDEAGNMEAPDSTPTITARNESAVDRSANLSAVSNVSTGHYKVTYTVAVGHAIEQIIFEWSVVEGGVTRKHGASTQIVDTTAVDFTAADRTKLDTLHDVRIPGVIQPQTGDSYARLGTPAGASIAADIAAAQTAADADTLLTTTVASIISASSFTLAAGSPDNSAYNGHEVVITDAVTALQKASLPCINYTASTKTLGLSSNPVFTVAIGDKVVIKSNVALKGIVYTRTVDVSSAGAVAPNWGAVANQSTPVDLSSTNIGQVGLVTSLSAGAIASIWNAIAAGFTTAGSIGKKLADWTVGQVTSLTQAALALFATTDTGQTTAATGSVAQLSQGSGGGGGSVYPVMGPLVAVRDPGNRNMSPMTLEMFKSHYKQFDIAVLDADGNAITLTGKTLQFVVTDTQPQPVAVFTINAAGGRITINANVASVRVLGSDAAIASTERRWMLKSLDDPSTGEKTPLAYGNFVISAAV